MQLTEVPFSDWPLPGPRTTLLCARFLDLRESGPMEHHRWRTSSLKLAQGGFVQEHEHGMGRSNSLDDMIILTSRTLSAWK